MGDFRVKNQLTFIIHIVHDESSFMIISLKCYSHVMCKSPNL